MPFTDPGAFTNGVASPPINAAFLNTVRDGLNSTATFVAPPPSGGDDTAVLQALINTAQAGGGTVQLQAGTYKANLSTANAYQQVTVIGRGKAQTTIQGYVNTSPVFRFRGQTLGGGGLYHLTLKAAVGGGGIGLEHAAASGTNSHWIAFQGDNSPNATGGATLPFDIGWHLYNANAGDFSEDNYVEAEFLDCNKPVFYETTGGDPSFSGSGLVGNSVINLSTTVTSQVAITISANALPYNAPCTVLVHGQAAGQVVFNNLNMSRSIPFYGFLHVEGINTISTGQNQIWFHGGLSELVASGATVMGNFYLVDKSLLSAGQFSDKVQYRPFQRATVLAAGTTTIVPEPVGTCMVQVDVVASNYHYSYLLHCWFSPYGSATTPVALSNPSSLNGAGYGAPTFSMTTAGKLTITNASYSSAVTAWVSVVPLTAPIDSNRQNQT